MSDLLDEIRKRIEHPEHYVSGCLAGGALDSDDRFRARAVATLFETAEPTDEDSILRKIDLPAELRDAAVKLRSMAEAIVTEIAESTDGTDTDQQTADRLGFLANIVEDVSHLIENPATMLETLREDRDRWQQLARLQAESLALTEAALGASQGAVTELAQGQDRLVKLLENVSRFYAGQPPILPGRQPDVGKKADDLAMLVNELVPLGAYSYRVAVEIQRALDQEHRRPPDVLPEIHEILRQLTAIETDGSGRLVVADAPSTFYPPVDKRACYFCGEAADTHPWIDEEGGTGGRIRGECPTKAASVYKEA